MNTRILNSRDLRRVETQHADAIPPLMERAGAAAAAIARKMLEHSPGTPLIIAGPGNNGGDAFVVARLLREAGNNPVVLFSGDTERLPVDARQAQQAFLDSGGLWLDAYPKGEFSLIVDGLFGIGLSRPITGHHAEWIGSINASSVPVLALDIPSGLNGDTGNIAGICVRADHTATFIASKPGLLTADGPDYCGEITVCDLALEIGTTGGQYSGPNLFKNCLLPRRRNSHKGSYGNVSILGGTAGMAGAALLAGRATLKLGAGRVYLGMLDVLAVDTGQPELMLRTPNEVIALATVLAIGPGLGQSMMAAKVLAQALASSLPLVIDADGLNLLGANTSLQDLLAVRPAPTFLTPHSAEAARLLGMDTTQIQADRLTAALTLAQRFKAWVALKGCGSIIATPDGHWFINTTGNPGLATAGSGDVLTGILAALLAQHWPPLEALLGAVHLHGAAADACTAAGSGPIGLTAGELIDSARRVLNTWIDD